MTADLLSLAERVEREPIPTTALWMQSWAACFAAQTAARDIWLSVRGSRFVALIYGEALIDAAEMLRPEGCLYVRVQSFSDGWYVDMGDRSDNAIFRSHQAPTEGSARLAAALRVRAAQS